MFSVLNWTSTDTPMFSFVPYLWFRSLIHRLISFVVITTPHLPPRGLSTGSASSNVYYWVWSLISFQWKYVALAKLCLQSAILSLQLWKCCRQTHIKGRPPCEYLLYLVLHSVVLVYVILSFRMYVKFKQLWFTVILKYFKFYFSLFFCIQLIIWFILYGKARIYFFSLMKHFFGTIWGWIDAVPLREGQALTHSLKVQPDLWNSHRSIVSLTAFDYWGRKQSERIRHNFRVRESFGLGFRWCS